MSAFWNIFLEILKVTIPSLLVFITVYYVLKQFLDNQYQLRLLDLRKEQQSQTLPLKLQAYERLSLFCERISPESLVLRLRTPGMTPNQLRYALLMAVHKEYEHNLSQQVYVSEQLWEIIRISKNEIIGLISSIDGGDDLDSFVGNLLKLADERMALSLHKALTAIKKEAALFLS